jgi:hypothetical protein
MPTPLRIHSRALARTLTPVLLLLTAACATAGSTFRSGVGDAHLEHPPWYAGASASVVAADRSAIGHLPIAYQRGAAQSSLFDPRSGPGTPIGDLLAEMNAYLDSLTASAGVSVRLLDASGAVAAPPGNAVPPDVRFGCPPENGLPGNDCAPRDGGRALGRGSQPMLLAVGRPSAAWIEWLRPPAAAKSVDRVLVLTLEVGQYWTRQTGLRGDKSVELGTGYTQPLPWLTGLEQPAMVLQLTGALVNAEGQAIRIGAEGIVAKRTGMLVGAIGGQELLADSDVAAVRSLVRDDLQGRPLAWKVALRHLVEGLTGRSAGAGYR